MKHIIDLVDLELSQVREICNTALDMMDNREKYSKTLDGKILGSLFFEPSTRTNLSFDTAIKHLGGNVIGFSDASSSSTSKGESLLDTVKTVAAYSDVLVMRHPLEGSARACSLHIDKPLINAGDGGHLHPTQTITDLVTILKYHGKLEDFTIGLCGDLKNGRTVQSLIKSLVLFSNIKFVLIAPTELQIQNEILDLLKKSNATFTQVTDLESALPELDILYMTRIQRERFENLDEYNRLKNSYILNAKKLEVAKENLCIMHPLPRVDEISTDVDDDPRAVYFKQVECGMYARMALFYHIFSDEFSVGYSKSDISQNTCKNIKCITNHEKYFQNIGEELCGYCDKKLKY